MKLFILRKLSKFGLNLLLEHKDFLLETSSLVIDWWKGKKLAIVGPEGSGKDGLWNRLQGLEPQTTSSELNKIPTFKINFGLSNGKRFIITCKRSLNIGGEENHRDQVNGWRAVCNDSDIIFYMMSIDDLLTKNYEHARIEKDLIWFHKNLAYLRKNTHIHILINKIDTQINSHTDYAQIREQLSTELKAFDAFVRKQLEPWDKNYTGSTLISVYNENIYLKGIESAFNAVYQHMHKSEIPHQKKNF